MKLDQSLMNEVRKSSNDFLFDNFKKVVSELNFKDGMSGAFSHGVYGKDDEKVWIEVLFDNSWELTIWDDGDITLINPDMNDNDSIYATDYENLLKFMKKKGIRKNKECEYKDAELYIVDFNR